MMTKSAAPPLLGLMQNWPLTVDKFIDHAARWHGDREIVSRLEDGALDRRTYAGLRRDAARISNALAAHGIAQGDRVGTLAMNGGAHLAAWFAISGTGAVCHTLNPRFSDEQLVYIINHAGDRLIFADGAFAPILARIWPGCPAIEMVVFLSPPTEASTFAGPVVSLDAFALGFEPHYAWGGFDEESAAGLCYTSGTTGDPKGVLYSHRSNFLHTLMSIQPDVFGLSVRDVIMPVVPMYHANAWGLNFSAPGVGAKLVLPGARLDGASLCDLIVAEGVTVAAAVPTLWLTVLAHIQASGVQLPSLKRVIVGGAALSERIVREFRELGVEALAVWGMTEMSPIGGAATLTPAVAAMSYDEQMPYRLKQGRSPMGIELRIVNEAGEELPHDGQTMGALQVRGPSIARSYFGQGETPLANGFFNTGDIATIDREGFMHITDRAKDVIKSGGEWISSVAIEAAALSYPGVALAAVIGVPHPKWDERPIVIVEMKPDHDCRPKALLAHLSTALPRWWMPDRVEVVDAMPLGSTGKVDKMGLRKAFT